MKDPVTDPAEITKRIAKFKRRAPKIVDREHLVQVLESFPKEQRRSIYDAVEKLLGFDASYPYYSDGTLVDPTSPKHGLGY